MNPKFQTYYHLSFKSNLHEQIIIPHLPKCIVESENQLVIHNKLENTTISRFCMSDSLEGCLNSISHLFSLLEIYPYLTFYIYSNKNHINNFYSSDYLHDNKLVFDAYLTKEIWILENIELKLLGYFNISKKHLKEKHKVKLFNIECNEHNAFYHYSFTNLPNIQSA